MGCALRPGLKWLARDMGVVRGQRDGASAAIDLSV